MYYRNDCLYLRYKGQVLRGSFIPEASAVCKNITKKQADLLGCDCGGRIASDSLSQSLASFWLP